MEDDDTLDSREEVEEESFSGEEEELVSTISSRISARKRI